MGDKGPSNIFDEASKMFGKKRKKKKQKERVPPVPEAPSPAERESRGGDDLDFLDDEELNTRYRDIVGQHADLREFTGKVYAALGKSAGEVETYLNNPSNFDEESWEFVKGKKEEVASQLFDEKAEDVKKKVVERSPSAKSKKQRKGKFRGARKGWLKAD